VNQIPTVRSVDHVAYTVPNLDEAVNFFVDWLGGELIFKDGPFSDSGDGMKVRLNVDPRASCRLAMLRLGQTMNLELFEYEAPERVERFPRNSDVGGTHLALYVDDIDQAFAYLKGVPGVTIQGDAPHGVLASSPVAGQRWFYFLTPFGLQMELTSCPDGRFYAGLNAHAMASPAASWSRES
jgi:catechol 2,3-dioxygenase-like lactoylglutathione lyase family enzyme